MLTLVKPPIIIIIIAMTSVLHHPFHPMGDGFLDSPSEGPPDAPFQGR
jgi:hypothetical protein